MAEKRAEHRKIAAALNKCGLLRLRDYCTTKSRPVKNFDRDIEIVRYELYGRESEVPSKFGISRQASNQILFRYYKYALDAMEMSD